MHITGSKGITCASKLISRLHHEPWPTPCASRDSHTCRCSLLYPLDESMRIHPPTQQGVRRMMHQQAESWFTPSCSSGSDGGCCASLSLITLQLGLCTAFTHPKSSTWACMPLSSCRLWSISRACMHVTRSTPITNTSCRPCVDAHTAQAQRHHGQHLIRATGDVCTLHSVYWCSVCAWLT